MAQDIFGSSPELDARKRWATRQLESGSDITPVGHPLGAVARALQGALGGYFAGQINDEDKAAGAAMFGSLPGLGGSAAGMPPAAPMAAPQPPSVAPVPMSDASAPRGIRNNNPLNIENGNFTQSQPGYVGSDGRFARFDSPDAGMTAANRLLDTYQNKYGLNTPAGIIGRWAPAADGNNVSAYASTVAKQIGINPNDPITPELRPKLIAAMAQYENGRPVPAAQQPYQVASLGPVGAPGSNAPPANPAAPQNAPQQPAASPQGAQVAQASPLPGTQTDATATTAGARSQVVIPPEVQATIKRLGADPRTRGQAWQMYLQYAKPVEQYEQGVNANGVPFQRNRLTGKVEADPTRDAAVNEVEYARSNWQKLGFPDPAAKDTNSVKFWQDFNSKRLGGPSTNVSIDQRGETEFSKEAGKLTAKRYNDIIEEAPQAKQMLSDVKTLQTLGTQIGTGKEAQVKAALGPYAETLGISIDKLPEIQAYEAIVNRVAPSLRVKGSGAQSDYELKNFLKSLPSLGNTEEGNALAGRVMEGIYSNKLRAAEIGSAALNGEITRKEADKQLRELPDPMQEYREYVKKNPGASVKPADDGGWTVVPGAEGVRIREKK